MERSHIPITKWLMGFYLMGSSKKGISAHQLHRSLGIKYQSAWFMAHRIREAMRDGGLLPPMGGEGGIVEADETYYGPVEEARPAQQAPPPLHQGRQGRPRRQARDRRLGRARRQRPHLPRRRCRQGQRRPIVRENVARESRAAHGREPALHRGRRRVRQPRDGQAHSRRVRPRRRPHEHGRGLLLASSSAG